jgi:hypothetical protein
MADNITTPFGTFRTDEISGVHTQIVKLGSGLADSTELLGGDAANGLDVDVTRVGGVGGTTFRDLDAKATVGINVKASAGKVLTLTIANKNAAIRYFKLYDKATAPTSADTPKATIPVQPNSTISVLGDSIGASFPTGIGYRASTGVADNDNNDPTANDVIIFGTYA